jgi:ribosomal protein L7Ae-like RNA K-turn-binding protein
VRALAAERAYEVVEVPSSADLGRACGLPRPVAAAALLRAM